MREITFRGYQPKLKKWVYGDLIHSRGGGAFIFEYKDNFEDRVEVNPDTVGQYTGLKDKNGNAIYEGDILKTYPIIASDKIGDDSFNCVVSFSGSSWIANGILGENQCRISEVIGNIFENKELIEK